MYCSDCHRMASSSSAGLILGSFTCLMMTLGPPTATTTRLPLMPRARRVSLSRFTNSCGLRMMPSSTTPGGVRAHPKFVIFGPDGPHDTCTSLMYLWPTSSPICVLRWEAKGPYALTAGHTSSPSGKGDSLGPSGSPSSGISSAESFLPSTACIRLARVTPSGGCSCERRATSAGSNLPWSLPSSASRRSPLTSEGSSRGGLVLRKEDGSTTTLNLRSRSRGNPTTLGISRPAPVRLRTLLSQRHNSRP